MGKEWSGGGVKHQGRESLYDEINAIIGLGWVHDYDVLDWYGFLKKEAYPNNNGMFENNVIFRLNTENVRKVNEYWWWSMNESKVRRDQFSLMWAIWKTPGIKTMWFLQEDENAWHNDGWFSCFEHNPHKRVVEMTLWEKMRSRYVRMLYFDGGWEIYYTRWFDKLLRWPFPHLMMHVWTAAKAVRYDSGLMLKRAVRKMKRNN